MKKRWPLVAIISLALIAILGVLFYLLFLYDSVDTVTGEESDLTEVAVQNGDLKISVDPRIELLSSVQLAGGYNILGNLSFQYRDEMENNFKDFKSHAAVRHFTWLSGFGFTYDASPRAMLHLTAPPSVKQIVPYDSETKRRGFGAFNLDRFNSLLADYSADSDFPDFYNGNKAFYKQIVESTAMSLKEEDIVKELEDYYGIKQKSYSLILAPLFHPGGYGIRVNGEGGIFDTYAIIGPFKVENKVPVYDGKEIRGLVWHEFSHSFINPLNERHKKELARYSSLYLPVKEIMSAQAYPNWEICVNEHLVRAVSTRLTYLKLGKKEGDAALRSEKGSGFIYIEALCSKLEEYEKNRDLYKTLDDFYPEILKSFDNLSKVPPEELAGRQKYEGPINGIFAIPNPVALIVPTNEQDKDIEEKIRQYVDTIKDRFFKEGRIITDKAALDEDLSGSMVIAYGTMDGNLWLSSYKDSFPFLIEPDGIIADTEYEGTGYRYICGYKNPQNEDYPLLIYTAQDASDIPGINGIMHGPTDYVIAKGDEVVKSGDFVRDGNVWAY